MVGQETQIPAICERAIRKYEEIAEEAIDVEFLLNIKDVDDLTKEIDTRNTKFAEFRERRGVIFDVLKAAMIPVQLLNDVAAGGVSIAFPPSGVVFGALALLIGAAKGVSASYDAIQDLMGALKNFTTRLKTYSTESISENLSDKLSDVLVALVEIFALSMKTIRRGRLLKFTRNILHGNGDAIQVAMTRLDNLTMVETRLVGAETLTESKRTGRLVNDVSVTVSATNATVMDTGITVHQMNARVSEVQDMLGTLVLSVNEGKQERSDEREQSLHVLVTKILRPSRTDPAQDCYDNINKARIPGTGDWVRNEDIFNGWVDKATPIIFISGNPGAGKSYLSTNIISFLCNRYPQHVLTTSLVSVGYFFFKDNNPETRSFHQALRDVAFQISKNDPVYQKYLSTIGDYANISNLESAWRLLFREYFLQKPKNESIVYILLDAVDEAFGEEREIFISLAKDLYDVSNCRLRLALVGRPHISDQLLEGLEVEAPTIHVTRRKNSSDIGSYIQASIKKSAVLRRVSAGLRQEITEKLYNGADGMFLWVNLMLQELVKKRNESSMRRVLEHPPSGLKEIMRHVLSSLSASCNEEELEYFNEIVIWITMSKQPLTLAQLDSILKFMSPEGDGMIYLEGALRRQFASFFDVNREDGLTTAELQSISIHSNDDDEDEAEYAFDDVDNFTDFNSDGISTTITFAHASIGDFFRDESEGKVSAGDKHIAVGVDYREAKAHLLKAFLKMFTNPDFAKRADDGAKLISRGHNLFHRDTLVYAANNWVFHLQSTIPSECSAGDREEIAKMLLSAFRSDDCIIQWVAYRAWESTTANIHAVRQWWTEREVLESLTQDERDFISATEHDPITTFRPVTLFCLDKWVRGNVWDPFWLAGVVWNYQQLIKGIEVHILQGFNPSSKELVDAAGFEDSQKNALWYRRCAIVLRRAGHHEKAIEFFNTALCIDPENHETSFGMAKAYHYKGELQNALHHYQETRKRLSAKALLSPDDDMLKKTQHDLLEEMGDCYEKLDNMVERHQILEEAYAILPYCKVCVHELVDSYYRTNRHDRIVDILRQLERTSVPGKDYSRLTQVLWEKPAFDNLFCRHSVTAGFELGSLEFIVQCWQSAISAARKASKTVTAASLELDLAGIYREFLNDQPKSTKLLEKIVNVYGSSTKADMIGTIKLEASGRLAEQLLMDVLNIGIGTPDAGASLAMLERLGMHSLADTRSWLRVTSRAAAIFLGVYYRLNGQMTESRAMFTPFIKRCIQILSDDDPENDVDGLRDLFTTLIAVGDTRHVIAIAHALGAYQGGSTVGDGKLEWGCNGLCHQFSMVFDDRFLCTICYDVGFCRDCTTLLDAGNLGKGICDRKHVKHFIYIPQRAKNLDKKMMSVDGEEMKFEAWLSQLKTEWNV
ncbi:NACHT and TPR domain protein [Aspergillus californicus]